MEKSYFHGSFTALPIGTVLKPSVDYKQRWEHCDFYQVLEYYRPNCALAHHHAVFMCSSPDDIDAAGGATDYLFTLKPQGVIEKHDMAWGTEIGCYMCDKALSVQMALQDEKIQEMAFNYWNGISTNDPVWEFLTPSATITHAEAFDDESLEIEVEVNPTPSNKTGIGLTLR